MTIILDIFDDQLKLEQLVIMQDVAGLLDRQLQQLGKAVLRPGGRVGTKDTRLKAEEEYDKFDKQRKVERYQKADKNIAALASEAKQLSKRPQKTV